MNQSSNWSSNQTSCCAFPKVAQTTRNCTSDAWIKYLVLFTSKIVLLVHINYTYWRWNSLNSSFANKPSLGRSFYYKSIILITFSKGYEMLFFQCLPIFSIFFLYSHTLKFHKPLWDQNFHSSHLPKSYLTSSLLHKLGCTWI